jgi:polyhydroxyalkanoate synthesis regulator phasin
MDHKLKDAISAAFEKLNIPTRDDMASLEKKIQGLSARLSKLEGGDGKGGD